MSSTMDTITYVEESSIKKLLHQLEDNAAKQEELVALMLRQQEDLEARVTAELEQVKARVAALEGKLSKKTVVLEETVTPKAKLFTQEQTEKVLANARKLFKEKMKDILSKETPSMSELVLGGVAGTLAGAALVGLVSLCYVALRR